MINKQYGFIRNLTDGVDYIHNIDYEYDYMQSTAYGLRKIYSFLNLKQNKMLFMNGNSYKKRIKK